MQVTTVDSHITHAVMGGMDVIECGITGDAHFMHMMSATLYRNQKLAMVRETLCNAWDAHIMVDKQIPIEVWIDNEENVLYIRDHGPGISHEMIGPIYGVYGASTKKNDGRQTGGFGLGCKSPWSYTDTFEVTSCHMGKKAIYLMTKSSAEREGKPGIKPIVANIPTTETGITVKIRLKQGDTVQILRLIERVLKYGGIPCILNHKPYGYVDYSAAKHNWIIVNGEEKLDITHGIFVRYGNVIYPLVEHEQYRAKLREMNSMLSSLPKATQGYITILTAPPDSLTPTPSREELSLTELSLNTIDGLISDFLSSVKIDGQTLAREIGLERVKLAPLNKMWATEHELPRVEQDKDLFSRDHTSYYDTQWALKRPMTTAQDLVEASVTHKYPASVVRGFRKDDIDTRMARLLPELNPRLVNMYKRERRKLVHKSGKWVVGPWLWKNLIGRIGKKMFGNDFLRMSNLYVWGKPDMGYRWHHNDDNAANLTSEIVEWNQSGMNQIGIEPITLAPFMCGRVIITHARKTLSDRMYHHPKYGHKADATELRTGFIVYTAPRSPKHVAEAFDFFTKLGYEVIDVTKHQAWEGEEPVKVVVAKDPNAPKPVKKKKRVGWVRLDQAIRQNGRYDPYAARDDEDALTLTEPLFYVTLKPKGREGYDMSLDNFSTETESRLACKLYGHLGVIVQRSADVKKLEAAGVKSMTKWVLDRFIKEMLTNKRILADLGNRIGLVESHVPLWLATCIRDVPELAALYPVKVTMTERDGWLKNLWFHVQNRTGYYEYARSHSKQIEAIKAKQLAVPASRFLVELSADTKDNLAIEVLNGDVLSRYLKSDSTEDAEKRKTLLSMLIDALKG